MSDATNLQAFQTALAICTAQGAAYQPTKPMLVLASANTAFADSHTAVDDSIAEMVAEKLVVNDREAGFIGSGKLATRILAAVETSGASKQDVEDMKGFVRKVHGGRTKKIQIDDPNTPEDESKHISVSQRGYSDVVEHFEKIHELLIALGADYDVNEPDLKVNAIKAKITDWTALNQATIDAGVATKNSRNAKNALLYENEDSLYERLRLMKKYFLQAFGSDSDQYNQISALKIVKPGKR